MGPALWEWALNAYSRPDAAQACLALQDDHGQSVSYLLWAIWAGEQGALTPAVCAKGASVARAAEQVCLRPLRARRRGSDNDRARDQIKGEELAAERRLLEALEHLTPMARDTPLSPTAALDRATQAWGGDSPPKSALERLARTFSTL